jgi:hypothetical protein
MSVVYLRVDGVSLKAGLKPEKARVLIVLASVNDERSDLLCLMPEHQASTVSVISDPAHFAEPLFVISASDVCGYG